MERPLLDNAVALRGLPERKRAVLKRFRADIDIVAAHSAFLVIMVSGGVLVKVVMISLLGIASYTLTMLLLEGLMTLSEVVCQFDVSQIDRLIDLFLNPQ